MEFQQSEMKKSLKTVVLSKFFIYFLLRNVTCSYFPGKSEILQEHTSLTCTYILDRHPTHGTKEKLANVHSMI